MLDNLMADALFMIQSGEPYRTGDLKRSFILEPTEDGFIIYTEIPYMQYTNETWGYNKRWGKQLLNKHEGWFDERVEMICDYIAQLGGGYVVIE